MKNPQYSIIIPTYNNAKKLKQCLSHLTSLIFPKEKYEIIVIDNGSKDDTKSIVEQYSHELINIKYFYEGIPGLMAARHKGYKVSSGEILCFIDDDSLVDKKWLEGLSDAYSDKDVVCVGGPIAPKYEEEPSDWLEYLWSVGKYGKSNMYLSLIDFGEEMKEIEPKYVYGCNHSIRKKVFEDIMGTLPDTFPEEYLKYSGPGETGETKRIINCGKTIYHPKVKIEHIVSANRLHKEYIFKRSFINGIQQSYLFTRKQLANNGKEIKRALVRKYLLLSLKSFVIPLIFPLIFFPRQKRELRIGISQSFIKGHKYHIKEIWSDPKLLIWIGRKSYWGENGNVRLIENEIND